MNQTNLFSNKQLYKLLWPLLIEQLLAVLVGMVDVVMVASLGAEAVSGVSLVDAVNQLLIQFLAALTAGGTVVTAQFIGMKDEEKTARSAGQLLLVSVGGAVFITLLFLAGGRSFLRLIFGQVEPGVMNNANIYFMITACSFPFLALYNAGAALFRSVGNSRISMNVSLLMNGLNVAGNALCIYVLKMGVEGVAVPTLIARLIAAALIMYLLQHSDHIVKIKGMEDFRPNRNMIGRIFSIGIPNGIENGIFQFGKLMLQSLVSTLGTAAIAGYAVAGNLVTFLYLPGNALGIGLTTVVGQCVGAGEAAQAKQYTRKFVFFNYAMLAVIASVLGFGRFYWISLYQLTGEAVRMAGDLVLSHCIAMIIWPIAFLTPYAFRAANDAKFTMIISIICMWVFRVAFAYLFVQIFHLDIVFVWIAMYLDWVVRIIAFIWRFRSFEDRIHRIRL